MLPSTAQGLALRYAQAISAYWRGEPEALRALERQLAACWRDGPTEPTEPSGAPTACSPHAAGGRGIRWHDAETEMLGFVSDRDGCYRVPASLRLTARPLGALAEVLAEEYGPPVRTAIARIAAREREARRGDAARDPVRARAYDEREAARQWLQPGCWVTLGEVTAGRAVSLVEVNVATGALREVCRADADRPGPPAASPAGLPSRRDDRVAEAVPRTGRHERRTR